MDVKQGVSELVKRGDATGSSELTQVFYSYADLKIGSTRIRKSLIDTGSWLTHIFDSNVTCSGCKNTGLYNSSQSSTVVKLGKRGQSFWSSCLLYRGIG